MPANQFELDKSEVKARRRSGLRNQPGAVLPFVAVSMIGMMALLVMVIDGGALQRRKRMQQAAADAGALAGANEVFRNRPASEIPPAARRETARNGFTDGANSVVVTVTYPTTSVNSPGSDYVKVVVQQTLPTIFGGLLDRWTGPVRAEAVAGLGAANNCLVLLEPTEEEALSVTAGATLTGNKCGIAVNSTSTAALEIQGGTSFITAPSVAVTGNEPNPGNITGSYQSGVPPTPDPLGYLTMPSVGACNAGSAGANYGAYQNYAGGTLTPGVYCGGIGMDNGVVATFSAGLYILAGGGLNIKHATVTGTGVTFVNTNAPAANGGASYGPFNMEVNSDVTLSTCTTYDAIMCPLPGILFYQDPAAAPALDPNTGELWVNFIGSSSGIAFNGSMYFPTQAISTKSHSPVVINGGLVVQQLTIKTGQENFVINGLSGGGGNFALKKATIVE